MWSHKLWKEKFLFPGTIVITVCIGLCLASISPAWATERPRPGEIEKLKKEGLFESRLEFVNRIGNHNFDSDLVNRFKQKILALQKMQVQALPPGRVGMPTTGVVRIFALLIEFQDYAHTVAATTIDDMLFNDGNPANAPRNSLRDWYHRASYGMLDLGAGSTLGWYQTAYDRNTIPTTDTGRDNLIKEVLNHYDSLGHDFSQYDNDGDGDIDYFIVMWTGPDTGWGSFWWGYQPSFSDGSYTLDGKTLSKYSWQWESSSPTVVIHETGHALGLPDYYDYDDAVGPDGGVGGFDMMDANRWDHNCFSKWLLDWLTPTLVSGGKQDLILYPTAEYQDAVLIWPGAGLGDIFSEYYMVQNRQDIENDDDGWFNVDGLAIWHIDATLNDAGTNFRYNNSSTDHKLLRLMEADGLEQIETEPSGGAADSGDIYNEGDRFSQVTTPSSAKYDGTDSCVTVCNIIDHGIDAEMSASFSTACSLPPTCDAGGPYSAECQGTSTEIALDGTGSSDPDFNETLYYSWTTDVPGASFDDDSSPTPVLTVDTSNGCSINGTVTLTVTDCAGNSNSCSAPVTVQDTLPPNIVCPQNITVECTESCGIHASDSQLFSFFAGILATDQCDPDPLISNDAPAFFGIGATTVTFTATDYCGNMSSCTAVVTVVDTTPPEIEVTLSQYVLWPPNHKLVEIDASVVVTDVCDPDATFVLTSITSNEPDDGLGDGDAENDIQDAEFGTADTKFQLRAERAGVGDGRVYTIVYTAYDSCNTDPNNTTSVTVYVLVPSSQKK